jgi:hypothetical protein
VDGKSASGGVGAVGEDALPGCLGYYGAPVPPNGPCDICRYKRLCRHVKANFVPKVKLDQILERIEEMEARLRG